MESTEEKNYHEPNTTVYWNPKYKSYTLKPMEENSVPMTYKEAIETMKERAGG